MNFWTAAIILLFINLAYDAFRDYLRHRKQMAIENRNVKEAERRLEEWRKGMEAKQDLHEGIFADAEKDLPERKPFATYTAFGGADLNLYFNSKPVGEVQEIEIEEDFLTNKVTGSFFVALFEARDFDVAKYKDTTRIDLKFANEYGFQAKYAVEDVEVTGRKHIVSIDDIVVGHRYFFKASKVTPVEQ